MAAVGALVTRWSLSLSPRAISKSSRSTTRLFSTTTMERLRWGGDFAGLMAKFSPDNGSVVPVPSHWIPAPLVEWGQEPSCVEVLCSEDWNGVALRRREITVLPATGCGVDNLETIQSEYTLDQRQVLQWSQPSESILIFDATIGVSSETEPAIHRLETHFSLFEGHRVRVSMDLQIQTDEYRIQTPIIVQLERQIDATSSGATRADGGGLDGRTVSQLLGGWLGQSHSFAEKRFHPGDHVWKLNEESSTREDRDGWTMIHLPGNITISSGPVAEAWVLQISHFQMDEESSSGSRRIVERKYSGVQCQSTYQERAWRV